MKTIWKFPLLVTDRQCVEMSAGAVLLTAQSPNAGGGLALWALVDPYATTVVRHIAIRGTGHPIDDGLGAYVATVQQGPLVWHVFDLGESNEG